MFPFLSQYVLSQLTVGFCLWVDFNVGWMHLVYSEYGVNVCIDMEGKGEKRKRKEINRKCKEYYEEMLCMNSKMILLL